MGTLTQPQITALLLQRDPLPVLTPKGVWREDLTPVITGLSAPPLVLAGLHLWNDDIDRCHRIAQAHEAAEGNYWHAILHRREPDYSNAKYWYRRVGKHPIFSGLRASLDGLGAAGVRRLVSGRGSRDERQVP